MSVREQLDNIAKERILILDGAMGSMIQTLNLSEDNFRGSAFSGHPVPLKGCNDLLCLTKPEAISAIHDAYLDAGADIIKTCSFNSTPVSLSGYGIGNLAYEISAAAAKIARKSAGKFSVSGKPRFVAGSIGPTGKGASLYPDINDPSKRSINWDELEAAYYDNVRGLLDGGADILLLETIFDTLNAKAALFAISRLLEEQRIDVPVMISATISGEMVPGRLLSGQTLEAFCISVLHIVPWAIGLNCSLGSEKLLPHIRQLSKSCPCLVSAHPNAGLPDQNGVYNETPETMASHIETYLKEGLVNIVGGCCGSTPAHIAAIAGKAAVYAPRSINFCSGKTNYLAGFVTTSVVTTNVAATNVAALSVQDGIFHVPQAAANALASASEAFFRCLDNGEYEDAADEAQEIVENGAAVLEIKTDNEETLCKFLDHALMNPYIAKVPFMINSSRWNVIEAGLKRLQGRSLAGPINMEAEKDEVIRMIELIRRYGGVAFHA